MAYKRYCVICGNSFESESPYEFACSVICNQISTQDEQAYLDDLVAGLVPKALGILGLDSIDEYAQLKEEKNKGCVYFIQSGKNGFIKIGFTTDIDSRLRDLQVASPDELRLLAEVDGTLETESGFHARFADSRMRGEWFAPDPALVSFISGL